MPMSRVYMYGQLSLSEVTHTVQYL